MPKDKPVPNLWSKLSNALTSPEAEANEPPQPVKPAPKHGTEEYRQAVLKGLGRAFKTDGN